MLCDLHANIYHEDDYARMLAEIAQNLGIDKLCIGGGEARYGFAGDVEVLNQAHTYPDLFVPFAGLRLGRDGPDRVEALQRMGFRGLRVSAPPAPYDSVEFYPAYEAAAALALPVLFHTGFLPPTKLDRAEDVRSHRMRPVYVDTLARQFPDLTIIGSGLGGPWYEEACEVLRRHRNVYFDLSGGAVRRKGASFFRGLMGSNAGSVLGRAEEKGTWSQIVFGTGVRHEEIAATERDYQRLFRTLALSDEVVADIMGGNAERMLGL